MLVEGDQAAANWLGKLEVVKGVLVDASPVMRPELDALTHAYIYMQWIATGAVACVEGGGHHRPNRHAGEACAGRAAAACCCCLLLPAARCLLLLLLLLLPAAAALLPAAVRGPPAS